MQRQRHPPGLAVLFFTEMWERFSFYCMLALFVFYMEDKEKGNGSPFLQRNASQLYGLYLGFVYFTPFFGGMLADRRWGYRLSILAGAVFMGVGQFLLALNPLPFFFAGLLCLVVGNGLFKPNISTLVGKLYPPNDPRLDNAFTIFYMGINLGALLAPLVAGYLRVRYGYHAAFAAAGVGMGVAIVVFLAFQRTLVFERGDRKQPVADPHVEPEVQRERHAALLIIFGVVVLFWMAFKQNGNTFALWWKYSTDRSAPAWLSWATFLQEKDRPWLTAELNASINPLFVILFSPLLVMWWGWLRARGWEPSTPAKVGIGIVLGALAFTVMAVGGLAGGDDPAGRMSMGYLILAYVFVTLGELCLSPIGLSLVSKLAAPQQRSAWMGGWFVATALGGYLSGLVGVFWKEWKHSDFFGLLTLLLLGAAAVLLLNYRRLRDAMPAQAPAPALPPPEPKAEAVPAGATGIQGPAPITEGAKA
jgi:POT family proton-dependent oligopeptide transporter